MAGSQQSPRQFPNGQNSGKFAPRDFFALPAFGVAVGACNRSDGHASAGAEAAAKLGDFLRIADETYPRDGLEEKGVCANGIAKQEPECTLSVLSLPEAQSGDDQIAVDQFNLEIVRHRVTVHCVEQKGPEAKQGSPNPAHEQSLFRRHWRNFGPNPPARAS
jgi:hypothetical protein